MADNKRQKQRYLREIAIREPIEKPTEHSVDKDIEWICDCLGLADKENDLASEIFKELIKATKERDGLSSKEITDKNNVTQGAIVYHLNIFMSSGLVVKQGRRYFLRSTSLDETIEELEQDLLRRMKKLRELAKHIDEEMFRDL